MTIISVGGRSYYTSEAIRHSADQHEHEEINIDQTKYTDGHITLEANPPPENKYIHCKKGSETVFTVGTDGHVVAESLISQTGIETQDNGAFVAKYSNNSGILRMGRQPNIGDQTVGLLDGIHHERTIDSNLQFFRQQLHPSQPKLQIKGTTDSGVDWLKITDSTSDNDVFAIHSDGTIQTDAWNSVDIEHPDQYSHSVAVHSDSLYIGKCKLSESSGQLVIKRLKAEPYIPKRLTEAPYNYTVNNINANTVRTINDWIVLARSTAGLTEAESKSIRIRDIFPTSNEGDDFLTNTQASSTPVTNTVYVDNTFTGASDGSISKPYASLNAAMNAKIVEGENKTFIFQLSEGVYTESISKTMTSKTHHVVIQGAGLDRTIIQSGSDFANGKDTDCIFMRRFKHVEIRELTIRNCKYGFYPRDCDKAVIDYCKLTLCGSDGTPSNHDFSKSQADQLAVWQGSSTSNGGACRIRECSEIQVSNCIVSFNLRGLRLQNCGTASNVSHVSNNKVYKNLESGIYLASTNYNGTDGCQNVMVCNNKVFECFNNGLLCIGGQNNQFMSNVVRRSANAGFQSWHSVNTSVINNFFYDCNVLSYNGIGNNGDAMGCIVFSGNSQIQSGYDYMGVIQGNSMIKCNPGIEQQSKAIVIFSNNYPQDSNKIILDTNTTDAQVKIDRC